MAKHLGFVKWYDQTKGYGFIEQADGKDLFVHYRALRGRIDQGDKVEYQIGEGKKGPCAIQVKVVEKSAATDQSADIGGEPSEEKLNGDHHDDESHNS